LVVPEANLAEICLAGARGGRGFRGLREVCDFLAGAAVGDPESGAAAMPSAAPINSPAGQNLSLDDVKGQWRAKRALVIAAAGGHSLLLCGPPGSGKSLLAARLPSLLPALAPDAALEVAGIASLGPTGFDPARWGEVPFRAPHHSASAAAIVGGGPRLRPGEISLAHRGVLFLDELPEFDRRVLEALREPLETGQVTIARTGGRLELPADFQLVAAMNPCPCGYLGDPQRECRCGAARVQRYRSRLSGPLLDRIDLHIEVPRLKLAALAASQPSRADEPAAAELATATRAARALQQARQGCDNARLGQAGMARHCALEPAAGRLAQQVGERFGLSGRAYHRLLKVARTIADLAGAETIAAAHLGEAAGLRPAAPRA
jgi:magnesium chelatase family protein